MHLNQDGQRTCNNMIEKNHSYKMSDKWNETLLCTCPFTSTNLALWPLVAVRLKQTITVKRMIKTLYLNCQQTTQNISTNYIKYPTWLSFSTIVKDFKITNCWLQHKWYARTQSNRVWFKCTIRFIKPTISLCDFQTQPGTNVLHDMKHKEVNNYDFERDQQK